MSEIYRVETKQPAFSPGSHQVDPGIYNLRQFLVEASSDIEAIEKVKEWCWSEALGPVEMKAKKEAA